jgi:hypothetical protein
MEGASYSFVAMLPRTLSISTTYIIVPPLARHVSKFRLVGDMFLTITRLGRPRSAHELLGSGFHLSSDQDGEDLVELPSVSMRATQLPGSSKLLGQFHAYVEDRDEDQGHIQFDRALVQAIDRAGSADPEVVKLAARPFTLKEPSRRREAATEPTSRFSPAHRGHRTQTTTP